MNSIEARFWGIFEHVPMSVQLCTRDGRTIAVNPGFCKLWGTTREVVSEMILNKYNILEDPNIEASGHMPFLKRGFAGEFIEVPPFHYEPLKIGMPGRERWSGGWIIPLKNENGEFTEVAIVHNDITEKYELEIERERLIKESLAAIGLRDEFLSIASHEFRTPISSLGLQIEVLSNLISSIETPDTEHANRVIGNCKRQLERLTKLVNDLLDATKMASGKMSVNMKEENFTELTRSVLDRIKGTMDAIGIELKFTAEPDLLVVCDAFRIDQVITNLMANAIRYGRLKPIEVRVEKSRDKCALRVKDQGMGIAKEDQERIFNRFERGPNADMAGLGLGLFINREIIEEHKGQIFVESELGRGSTFVIELPLKYQKN